MWMGGWGGGGGGVGTVCKHAKINTVRHHVSICMIPVACV